MLDYRHVLVAVDNSAHSNRAIDLAVRIARASGAQLTGAHAYAARLHDARFRQMEGGLPEAYRHEVQLEHQREVHDDLIERGLQVISDSYLDVVADRAAAAGITAQRRALEGKNYRVLLDDVARSDYDLVVIGARGLGAVAESVLGSVCDRVARHIDRDLLVAKDPERPLDDGPIVVAVDGSPWSFAALETGCTLSRRLGVPLEVVSAFDPYFHYVAFERIAGVLSDEAGRVFKFNEQEQLHEDIIDSGLATIYRSHLEVASEWAGKREIAVDTTLLTGKPFRAVLAHVRARNPSLVIVGRCGVHAAGEVELGSNAANVLRLAPCHVLLVARQVHPRPEDVVAHTTTWTAEAEQRMDAVPSFARAMARGAIVRFAHASGHTVITSALVDEAVASLLPPSAMEAMGLVSAAAARRARAAAPRAAVWTDGGRAALAAIADATTRDNVRLRAEKLARAEGAGAVDGEHVRRLTSGGAPTWSDAARARLDRVPAGFVRALTRGRIEAFAARTGAATITEAVVDDTYAGWAAGSAKVTPAMPWADDVVARLDRVPELVRGMVIHELEGYAAREGLTIVTSEVLDAAMTAWADSGTFHLDRPSARGDDPPDEP